MLIVLSGLPGIGKTTIARELARALGAVHLRIDSIEHALRQSGVRVEGEGYAVAYAIAENLARLSAVGSPPIRRRHHASERSRQSADDHRRLVRTSPVLRLPD